MKKHEMMDKIIQYQMRNISTSQVSEFLNEYTKEVIRSKVQETIGKLDELEGKYFKEYTNLEPQSCDWVLNIGKCAGVGEANDIIKELLK